MLVDLTEEEAQGIGKDRYIGEISKKPLLLFSSLLLIGITAGAISNHVFNLSDWITVPLAIIPVIVGGIYVCRLFSRAEKAGAEFVRSLASKQE